MKNGYYILIVFGVLLGIFANEDDGDQNNAPIQAYSSNSNSNSIAHQNELFVSGSVVNVRSGPSVKNKIISRVIKGNKVTQVGRRNGDWVYVESQELNFRGWMHGNYLTNKKSQVVTQPSVAVAKRQVTAPSNSQITNAKRQIIRQSVSSYPGTCACPYNTDRAGRRCGGRSAWSRPGGYSPICYDSDVSNSRLRTYFARVKGISY